MELGKEIISEEKKIMSSLKTSKIILPIVLGIGTVLFLIWRQFEPEAFENINWSGRTIYWILISLVLLVIRHLAYAARLRLMSDYTFGWLKSIKLIFIWEFSSAVSPTSLGGSAVALYVLSKEKLSLAKTATLVVYSIIQDTFFFITTLALLYIFLGPLIIRPGLYEISTLDGWGYTFFIAYFAMMIYGLFFAYGLFWHPHHFARMLKAITSLRLLRRYRNKAEILGEEVILAAQEIKKKKLSYHLKVLFFTSIAWSFRFLLLSALIIGFVDTTGMTLHIQSLLYARLETMFIVMAFSPTPGGAGIAEIVFTGFLSDYVPASLALIIAFIWRLFTYYTYLVIGAIIIPGWIKSIRKK